MKPTEQVVYRPPSSRVPVKAMSPPAHREWRTRPHCCRALPDVSVAASTNIGDPVVMDRYNAMPFEYLDKADNARIVGPMPPPRALSRSGRRGMDHD